MANFAEPGEDTIGLASVADMYSNGELLLDTSKSKENNDKIGSDVRIQELEVPPGNALVIKLPK